MIFVTNLFKAVWLLNMTVLLINLFPFVKVSKNEVKKLIEKETCLTAQ